MMQPNHQHFKVQQPYESLDYELTESEIELECVRGATEAARG